MVRFDSQNVIDFSQRVDVVVRRSAIYADAKRIEEQHGPNLYTQYLKKKGSRPDQQQAAVIGSLVGARVEDSNGKLQPPLDKGEKARRKTRKARQAEEAKEEEQICRLLSAIDDLSKNECVDPSALIDRCCPQLDAPKIANSLRIALRWLVRFDKEWHRREECPAIQT